MLPLFSAVTKIVKYEPFIMRYERPLPFRYDYRCDGSFYEFLRGLWYKIAGLIHFLGTISLRVLGCTVLIRLPSS